MNVTSPLDGKLGRILVEPYQTVAADEPLAVMDDSVLSARLETASAELLRLAAEVEGHRATLQAEQKATWLVASLEYPAELRAFYSDEAELEVKILETSLLLTTSEFEADRLEVNWRRVSQMAEESIRSRADLLNLENRLHTERARSRDLRSVRVKLQAKLKLASARRQSLREDYGGPPHLADEESTVDAQLVGWRAAIAVQQKRIEELAIQRAALVVRAPAAGRVASLLVSEGQFVLAGDTLFVVSHSAAHVVRLWVPESSPARPRVGDRYLVSRAFDLQAGSAEGTILAVSPRLELIPRRLWRDGRVAEYGQACTIGPVDTLRLVPGERVHIDPLTSALH